MFTRFDISILALGMPFDAQTLETRSLGGSESAAIYMARALSREGARVTVFANTAARSLDRDGVRYVPAVEWPAFAKTTPHDVCIVQRAPEAFAQRTNARLNVLWCHDLALGRQEQTFRGALWNIDRTVVLSRYMREQYAQVYGLAEDGFLVSRNGVDLQLFRELAGQGIERDRRKLIFAARPERGLDVLLREIMPRLLRRDDRLRLYVASYDVHPPEWDGFYRECDRLAADLGDRVTGIGCLTKRQLYAHYLSAGVYVYPTPSPVLAKFREVSCISAMECQAAGLPVVTTAIGALPETIAPGAGVLLERDPSEPAALPAYADAFADAVHTLVSDDRAWNRASAQALARAGELDWSRVARDWLAEFEGLIRARNDSPARLIRHFWRTSDIVAAKQVLGAMTADHPMPAPEREALAALLSPWSFVDEPDGYRRQYQRVGSHHEEWVYESAPREPRFLLLEDWLSGRTGEIATILDYGCAHGAYATALARHFPHLRIHGVDIDPVSIEMAAQRAATLGLTQRLSFGIWTHDAPAPPGRVPGHDPIAFDCALLQEVLEHVPEPWAVLERVEREIRRGGKVYLTVPFGPWELTAYRTDPHRCHIWHFDQHDLRDMIGSKPDLSLEAVYAEDSPLTGEPLGWWVASYTADHRPVPPLDLARHVWLQRPRQTVSAAIIAGPGAEETLHWMLRSIRDVADEIVIADCGMNDEARRIARQYEALLQAGLDPRAEGFERARNRALDASSCDWCLWIDTDEKAIGGHLLEKYLRDNCYHGYAIRQHHFACDTALPADLPVRLFRRRPFGGRTLRFWGAIHEHPELGLNDGAGPTICLPDVHIAHVGYLSESVRRSRLARNAPLLKLDQERYPDRLIQKHFVMRDNIYLVRHALLRSGGQVDEEMRARCRETIDLFRRHFLGKSSPMTRGSLEYYSEALAVLGEGFEAMFQVEADKSDTTATNVQRYRFASTDDLNAELKRVVKEKAGRFDSPWW